MKVRGLDVDVEKIAEGLYEIICKQKQEHIVAFGMIPAELMVLLEQQLRVKVIQESAKSAGCTVEELKPFVDDRLVREIVNPIMKAVGIEIYGVAKRAGKMIV